MGFCILNPVTLFKKGICIRFFPVNFAKKGFQNLFFKYYRNYCLCPIQLTALITTFDMGFSSNPGMVASQQTFQVNAKLKPKGFYCFDLSNWGLVIFRSSHI